VHAADFAVSKAVFARVNRRLNPRAQPFHQHTDFKRADQHLVAGSAGSRSF